MAVLWPGAGGGPQPTDDPPESPLGHPPRSLLHEGVQPGNVRVSKNSDGDKMEISPVLCQEWQKVDISLHVDVRGSQRHYI